MTDQSDNVEVERRELLKGPMPIEISTAFDTAESAYHEFGLPWLRNLAAAALSPGESAWLYIARYGPSDFVALPIRLNSNDRSAHALSTWYSSLWSPIASCKQSELLLNAIFKFMARTDGLASLTLSPIDPATPCFENLQAAMRDTPWKGVHTWTCFTNWIHPLSGQDYRAYLADRPSRLRNTILRKSRRFLQAGAGELSIVKDTREHPRAAAEFQDVYKNSWKQQEPFPGFIPGLLETASERGWLRLGLARYEGKPVAAQIWLVANGRAAIFKLAYHRDYASLSPGTVLTAHLMEHVIDTDRVDTIDYLTGDDDYKQHWMSVKRERQGIAAYNTSTLLGTRRWLSHRLKRLIKEAASR